MSSNPPSFNSQAQDDPSPGQEAILSTEANSSSNAVDVNEAAKAMDVAPAPISPAPRPSNTRAFETYNTIAETIGMVPSLRKRDNLIQAIVIGCSTFIAVIVGGAFHGMTGAIVAAMTGLILSLLLSGFVLMILGWVRAIRRI